MTLFVSVYSDHRPMTDESVDASLHPYTLLSLLFSLLQLSEEEQGGREAMGQRMKRITRSHEINKKKGKHTKSKFLRVELCG